MFVAVASGAGLGRLNEGVDPLEQAVAQVVGVSGDDAVLVVLHEGEGVCDELQAGAFRAVATASEVLGCVAGAPGRRRLGSPRASVGPADIVEFLILRACPPGRSRSRAAWRAHGVTGVCCTLR